MSEIRELAHIHTGDPLNLSGSERSASDWISHETGLAGPSWRSVPLIIPWKMCVVCVGARRKGACLISGTWHSVFDGAWIYEPEQADQPDRD